MRFHLRNRAHLRTASSPFGLRGLTLSSVRSFTREIGSVCTPTRTRLARLCFQCDGRESTKLRSSSIVNTGFVPE